MARAALRVSAIIWEGFVDGEGGILGYGLEDEVHHELEAADKALLFELFFPFSSTIFRSWHVCNVETVAFGFHCAS